MATVDKPHNHCCWFVWCNWSVAPSPSLAEDWVFNDTPWAVSMSSASMWLMLSFALKKSITEFEHNYRCYYTVHVYIMFLLKYCSLSFICWTALRASLFSDLKLSSYSLFIFSKRVRLSFVSWCLFSMSNNLLSNTSNLCSAEETRFDNSVSFSSIKCFLATVFNHRHGGLNRGIYSFLYTILSVSWPEVPACWIICRRCQRGHVGLSFTTPWHH